MRIAVSGAHGVGKTTLVNRIAEHLHLPKISEVARKVAGEMGLDSCNTIKTSDQESIRLFQSKVFYEQLMAESELIDFISDRSIFDIVAYMNYYGLCAEIIDDYLQYAIKHSAQYDAIIYCPVPRGAELVADGFRLTEGQKEYCAILKQLLSQAECRVVTLTRDRDQWLDRVLSIAPIKRYIKARKNT